MVSAYLSVPRKLKFSSKGKKKKKKKKIRPQKMEPIVS